MKGLRVLFAICSLFFLTALWSCAPGGTTADGGMGGTGISMGPITKFGSVFVNGVEFFTTGAVITKDGSSSDENHLGIGMIVEVHGTFDANGTTGTAHQIDFNDNLEGPIQNNPPVDQFLIVMGQTVKVDAGTKYHSDVNNVTVAGLNDLQTGYVIEVSGLPGADGTILATYIELKSTSYTPGEEIEVKGMISGLDATAQTFNIVINPSSPTALTVYYGGVTPPVGGFNNGMFVEVKSTAGFDINGTLIASEVEVQDLEIQGTEGTIVELEGLITRFVSATDFDVNGQPVATTGATVYEPLGKTSKDLALNARVEVEGKLDANGVLIAQHISFEN